MAASIGDKDFRLLLKTIRLGQVEKSKGLLENFDLASIKENQRFDLTVRLLSSRDKASELYTQHLMNLVKAYPDILQQTNRLGESILHQAVAKGLEPIPASWLQNKNLLQKTANNGMTLLHYTAFYNRPKAAAQLIATGSITVDAPDNAGHTALHYAQNQNSGNNSEIIDILQKAMEQETSHAHRTSFR